MLYIVIVTVYVCMCMIVYVCACMIMCFTDGSNQSTQISDT